LQGLVMAWKKSSIALTAREIGYLKELFAAGDRGRTVSAANNALHRLVGAGYVNDQAIGMSAVLYRITDHGRRALAAAK
jgi:DNA-binding MarR family transcriptional regulator